MMNWPFVRSLAILSLLSFVGAFAQTTVRAQPAVPAPPVASPSVDGIWLGILHAGSQTLRLQLHLVTGASGVVSCSLDSLDQGVPGIPCNKVKVSGGVLSFDVPDVGGKYLGTLSADGKTLTGTWNQGGPLPLMLERQKAAIELPRPEPPQMDAAMSPVTVTNLKPVLDRDLAEALKSGALASETNAGVAIGVVQHGIERVFSYGTAKPDSIFEIGSISKTFTGLILAQMVEQGKVKLDEPVRELLPPGTVAKPASGGEITLIDISDQHSGLPRMPDNFHPADKSNPYADYDLSHLYAYIAKHGVARAADAPFLYSNLAVGLLGQALANRAGLPYASLLADEITRPLQMNETAIVLPPELQARFIDGHDGSGKTVHAWDLNAFAGAGGIRSTAADMLKYLEAQLHPKALPAAALATPDSRTLPAAIAASHTIHAEVGGGDHIALNWFRDDKSGSYWHNGATGGYTAYAVFNPEKDFAVVVLCNTTGSAIADNLGKHIEQRLEGLAAVKLARELPKVVEVDPKVLDGYVGEYQLVPNFILTVTREGNRLITQATGQQKIEIFAESEKKFFAKVMDAQITFETDAEGRATGIILHQNGVDHEAKRVK